MSGMLARFWKSLGFGGEASPPKSQPALDPNQSRSEEKRALLRDEIRDGDLPVAVYFNLIELQEKGPASAQPGVTEQGLRSLKPANPEDYAQFLMKRLARGETITHIYDYLLGDSILTTDRSISIPRKTGSLALNVLVPAGVEVTRACNPNTHHDHGQNFNMDGTVKGDGFAWVPLYPNVAQIMKRQGWKPAPENFGQGINVDDLMIIARAMHDVSTDDKVSPYDLAKALAGSQRLRRDRLPRIERDW